MFFVMGLFRRGAPATEPEPEPEPTAKEKLAATLAHLLHFYGYLCAGGVGVIGFFIVGAIGEANDGFEGMFGALLGIFEVIFAVIMILAELRWTIVARYFGFMALHSGKGAFYLFTGALVFSLARAMLRGGVFRAIALAVGVANVVGGVLHLACALPCVPVPRDPLRKKLIDGTEQTKQKPAGGKRGKKDEVDLGRVEEGHAAAGGSGGGDTSGANGNASAGPWWARGAGGEGGSDAPAGGATAPVVASEGKKGKATTKGKARGPGSAKGKANATVEGSSGGGGASSDATSATPPPSDNPFFGNKHLTNRE